MPDAHAQIAAVVASFLEALSPFVPGANAGKETIQGIEYLRKSQAAKELLRELLASAEQEFIRESRESGLVNAADWVCQMPLHDTPSFSQALRALFAHWREDDLLACLSNTFPSLPGFESEEKRRATALYLVTLRRFLIAHPDFGPIITGLSQLRTEANVSRIYEQNQQILAALVRLDVLQWPVQSYAVEGGLRSYLLNPKYRLVPYSGSAFRQTLQELLDWAHNAALWECPMGVRIYTGAGGCGKTRLVIEAGEVLLAEGWRVGFVPQDRLDERNVDAVTSIQAPTLLILDYIDLRQKETEILLHKMAEINKAGQRKAPLILLLLEREMPAWLEDKLHSPGDRHQVNWPEFLELPGLVKEPILMPALELMDREALFEAACQGFQRLHSQSGASPIRYTSQELPGAPLLIALLALHAAMGRRLPEPAHKEKVFEYTWEREKEYWVHHLESQGADQHLLPRLRDMIEELSVVATLGRRFSKPGQLKQFLKENYRPVRGATASISFEWLSESIPTLFFNQEPSQAFMITPDPLADFVLRKQLTRQPGLIDLALPALQDVEAAPVQAAEVVWQVLTVLQRLRWSSNDAGLFARSQTWVDRVTQHLAAWQAQPGRLDFWAALEHRLPHSSLLLRNFAVQVVQALIRLTPVDDQSEHARLSNNLAFRLSDLGHRAEALAPAEEAVAIRRSLAEAQPEAFLPDLATSLNNLAKFLSELGRRTEALAPAEEAVAIRRSLAEAQPETFLPDLAMSLNNLANHLSNLGRRTDALAPAEEAVDLYRRLAEAQPEAFLPNLAGSLNTLANHLSNLGRRADALAPAEEAVAIRRSLAEAQPETFLPDLAMSLNNLALRLSNLGRRADALAPAEEAVDLYRRLAEAQPEAFLPDLAMSLNNLAIRLSELGRRADALAPAEEAVVLYRRLAEAQPEAFLPYLASSLNNLAIRLSNLGRRTDALAPAEEGVAIHGSLAEAQPEAFLPNLAMSLNNLALRLSELGRRADALAPAEEAVDLYRRLVEAQPEAFLPNLAMSLDTLAVCLQGLEELAQALEASHQSILILAPFFQRLPESYAEWMSGFMKTYRELCGLTGTALDHGLIDPIQAALDSLDG